MPTITAIEFTDLECRVLQAERAPTPKPPKGSTTLPALPRARVKALARFALPKPTGGQASDDPAAVASRVVERARLLKEALAASDIKPAAIGKVRVVIPRHYVHSRRATLPSTDDVELVDMARFEAERHIQINADRHVFGHAILARNGTETSDVLLAAVDAPVAQEYLDTCVQAGLSVDGLNVSTYALHRAYCAAPLSGPAASLDASAAAGNGAAPGQSAVTGVGVVALVNVGLAATDIVLVQDGRLAYTRSAAIGVAKLLADVAAADRSAPALELPDLAEIDALEPHKRLRAAAAPGQELAYAPPPPPPPSAATEPDPPTGPDEAAHPPPEAVAAPADVDSEATDPNLTLAPFLRVPKSTVAAAEHGTMTAVAPGSASVPTPSPSYRVGPTDSQLDASARAQDVMSPAAKAFAQWELRLLKELRNTYEFARREFGCPLISKFLVAGEGALIRNLPRYLEANFRIPAATWDPFPQACDVAPKLLQDSAPAREALSARPTLAYASLAGALIPAGDEAEAAMLPVPQAIRVNLIPPEYVAGRAARRQRQGYMVTGILAVTALALGYFWASDVIASQDARLDELEKANKAMSTKVAEQRAMSQRNDIVNRNIRDRHGVVEILDAISSSTLFPLIPDRASLTGFEFVKDEGIKISGYALTFDDANNVAKALERLGTAKDKIFASIEEDTDNRRPSTLPNRGKATVYQVRLKGVFPKRVVAKPKPKPDAAESE